VSSATLNPEPWTVNLTGQAGETPALHIPPGMPPVHLSTSRLNRLLVGVEDEWGNVLWRPGCTFAHQQEEHRRKPQLTVDDAGLGLRFHSFARLYVQHLIKRNRWTDPRSALSIAGELAAAPPALDARQRVDLDRLARIFLAGYDHRDGLIECERRFAFDFPGLRPVDPEAAGPKVAGSLDHYRLAPGGEEAFVLDYKSGPGAKFSGYNAYRNLQGQFYAWLLTLAYPRLRLVHFTLWGVAYGPQNKAHAEWTPETLNGLVLPRLAAGYVVQEQEYLAAERRRAAAPTDPGDWTARPHVQSCRFCQPEAFGCPMLVAAKEAREEVHRRGAEAQRGKQ